MSRFARHLNLGLLVFVGCALTAAAAPWADVPSDLAPDPAIRHGTLPNGLRYVIRPNAEPQDRVSLRLLVSAGSLVERDDERGLAHFIEHMAFRGTTAYPQDSLITTLERRGIALGPDNTAFTSFDFTVYHLELPDTQPDTLRLGLGVFREYATSLTFDPAAIAKERGVVLSEKDTRNTPEERVTDAIIASLWPDSRQFHRRPIGLETTIRQFTREQFVAFYNAWYRPERMAVVIVGNVDPNAAEQLVKEIFSPITARAPPRPEPADLIPDHAARPNVDMYVDNSLGGVRFYFTHPKPWPRRPDTHAERVAGLYRALAFAMFGRRLDWAARRRDSSYVVPNVTTDTSMPGWEAVEFSASGRTQDWRRIAADLEQEHRRAYLLGFTEDELELAKAGLVSAYDQAVRSAPTLRSEYLASQIEGALLYGGVVATPDEIRRDLAADLAAATLKECNAAFRSAWTGAPVHVLVTTNAMFPASRGDIGQVLNQSRDVPVHLPKPATPVKFAYTHFGRPGKLVDDQYLADLDVHLARFKNGVRLNFKPTTFEADTITINVRVGTGKLSQPASQPGLDYFASYGLINGGVGRHTSEEMDTLLSSHVLSIQFGVEPDACVFYARCARRDLTLALQVITAYLTDPAYRLEAISGIQASFGNLYSTFDATSGGAIAQRAERVITGYNSRLGPPDPAEAGARNFGELAQWLNPQFRRGAIELSIVGDVPWPEASAAVGGTLGTLRQRDTYPAPGPEPFITFTTPSKLPQLFSLNPALKQTALAWYWPMTDPADAHLDRRCRLLAAVVGELLFTRLREELGVTYTPAADFVHYEGWPTFSYFNLRADVAYVQGPKAAKIIRREIDQLLAHGIDEDVFLRARQPFIRSREEDLRDNGYWGHTVLLDAQLRPDRLAAARDRAADVAAITRGELEALARRYLDPDRGFMFVAEPGTIDSWGIKYYWDVK